MVKVPRISEQDKDFMKWAKKFNRPSNKELPKNTLRCKLLKHELGYHFDDFVYDRKTLRSSYSVYTFKR